MVTSAGKLVSLSVCLRDVGFCSNGISAIDLFAGDDLAHVWTSLQHRSLADPNQGRILWPLKFARPFTCLQDGLGYPRERKTRQLLLNNIIQEHSHSRERKMKLQIICVLFVLLSAAARNLRAFTIQRDVPKDLASLDTYKTEITGLQALLARPKRHISHIALCRYCWDCCGNKGFGFCCQT